MFMTDQSGSGQPRASDQSRGAYVVHAAAGRVGPDLLDRLCVPCRGLVDPGIQPRPTHPTDFALSFPARVAARAADPARRAGDPLAGRRASPREPRHRAPRQHGPHPRHRHLRLYPLGGRRDPDAEGLAPGARALAAGAAFGVHAAAAAVPLLADHHFPPARLLRDRGLGDRPDAACPSISRAM